MMCMTALLLLLLFGSCDVSAMTTVRRNGNVTTSEHNTLLFYITSRPGMDCFYQHMQSGSKVKVAFMTVDSQLQHLHMRITSESDAFSEWFEGVDRITYEGNVTETGNYEICVTAKIGYGRLKVLLDTFVYNLAAIEYAFNQYIEGSNLENSIEKAVDRVYEMVFSIFYSLRVYNTHAKLDTHLQEKNMRYIDSFSSLQTFFMIISALLQVYFIRKFFYVDPKRIRI